MRAKSLFLILLFVLWTAVACSGVWIAGHWIINQTQLGSHGFKSIVAEKRFSASDLKMNKDADWLAISGKIKNISQDQLNVSSLSIFFFNKSNELVKTEEYDFADGKTTIKPGQEKSFKTSFPRPSCAQPEKYSNLKCLESDKEIEVSYFNFDVNWSKEEMPEIRPNQLKIESVNLIKNMEIDPVDQTFTLSEVAKLSYMLNGKKKTAYGNYADMVKFTIAPKFIDADNDGIEEVVLVNEAHGSSGWNYQILKIQDDGLKPLNIVTEIYDQFGKEIETKNSDAGLNNLEIADFNKDGLSDLKSGQKIYYWDSKKGEHLRKVITGKN